MPRRGLGLSLSGGRRESRDAIQQRGLGLEQSSGRRERRARRCLSGVLLLDKTGVRRGRREATSRLGLVHSKAVADGCRGAVPRRVLGL